MKYLFLLSLIVGQVFAQESVTSYYAPMRVLRAKGYQLGLYGDSFLTSKTVDENGTVQPLASGTSFQRVQSELSGYYGATSDLQFGIGARFRQNKDVHIDSTTHSNVSGSSTGLQSTFFNFKYAFEPVDQMQYSLEGTFRYTPYTNEELTSTSDPSVLILGDTGNEISGGLGMTYSSKSHNFLTLRGGYRRPGSDLAHEIYWQAEGAMAWKYIALVAGVDGVSSLKDDPYDGKPGGDRPNLNTGSSRLYNSINREWVTPYAGVNIALGKTWRVELRGSQVVSGHSTDLGTAFGINLIHRVEKSQLKIVDNKFKTYDTEATVTKVSPKQEYVVIDKGLADDFYKGMRIDFFEFDYVGGNILVATGVVVQTKSDSCIVKISQKFNLEKEIKEGLIGRGSLK